jgi:16S rRNA (cytosine1402-N4)-methyltransferase
VPRVISKYPSSGGDLSRYLSSRKTDKQLIIESKGGKQMSAEIKHIPVALNRCIDLLSPALLSKNKAFLIDATVGLAGHAKELLAKFHNLHLIGIDRDLSALNIAKNELSKYQDRTTFLHSTFDQIDQALKLAGCEFVDGILFDLGVSSMQLDDADRGFSYSKDAPLDMRMDQNSTLTAEIILNTYSHGQLAKIIQNYGEERFASRIAEKIIKARQSGGLKTTQDLAQIVKSSIPAATRRTGGNPAKRTFQALRIEVNQELVVLEKAIPAALAALSVGGRLVVMSYQSLEDRIVKQVFTQLSTATTPLGLPVDLPNTAAKYRLLISGSEGASESEQISNPRSQSMRLRAIERVAA